MTGIHRNTDADSPGSQSFAWSATESQFRLPLEGGQALATVYGATAWPTKNTAKSSVRHGHVKRRQLDLLALARPTIEDDQVCDSQPSESECYSDESSDVLEPLETNHESTLEVVKTHPKEETIDWQDEEWLKMHEILIEQSLLDLRSHRTATKLVKDIILWICRPLVFGDRKPRGFSFQACAEVCGLEADEMQSQVLENIDEIAGKPQVVESMRSVINQAVNKTR